MKVILEEKKLNPEAIHRSLQKGYGIEHPERISGYPGFFANYGTAYVSDEVHRFMELSPEFRKFVFESLKRYQDNEYGQISEWDWEFNVEDKWLGGGSELFGRYAYGEWRTLYSQRSTKCPERFIKIRGYQGNTYILFDAEPDWLIREEPVTEPGSTQNTDA